MSTIDPEGGVARPIPRPGVMDITPYVGGESKGKETTRVIKLSSNEGALGPSPKAIAAAREAAGTMHLYPDGGATALRQALGMRWNLEPTRIVCGAGSDELITLLVRAFAGPGDEVLYSRHGFLMYGLSALSVGATPVTAPETADLRADVDALLARVTPRTKLVFIANPNNPTGSYLTADELDRLHAGLPSDVVFVIDAAYAEFSSVNDYSNGQSIVDRSENAVMLRTFSKIYGLGGMRLGWGYGPATIVDVLNRVRNPFNVSAAALAAGVAAVEDIAFTDHARNENDRVRAWSKQALEALGLEVMPSLGNFLLVRFTKHDPETVRLGLKDRGVLIRQLGAYGLPDCLRVSIGTEEEMKLALAAFDAVLKSSP